MIRLYGSGTGLSEDVLVKHKENNIAEIHFRSPIKVIWIDKDVALDIFREKGKWEEKTGRLGILKWYECSCCGKEAENVQDGGGCELLSNYCPYCGADMRGEE